MKFLSITIFCTFAFSAVGNDSIHVKKPSLQYIAEKGVTSHEMLFVFAWYGDVSRLSALLNELDLTRTEIQSLRFGKKAGYAFAKWDSSVDHWTLLHVAVLRNQFGVVKELVEGRNFRVDTSDVQGGYLQPPLEMLLSRDIRYYRGEWPRDSYIKMAQFLLHHGARVDATVFTKVISSGHVELMKTMLKLGADPNAPREPGGQRPLFLALHIRERSKRAEVSKLLVRHGADPYRKAWENEATYSIIELIKNKDETLAEAVVDEWQKTWQDSK